MALGILRKLGLRTDAVADGEEVLKALATLPYDLVLMDVQMPVMDGFEATRQIRDPSSPVRNHNIPVIAMTAHAMLGDQDRCRKAGMNDYIAKPVTPQSLAAMLEKWLLPKRETPPEAAAKLPPSEPGGGASDAPAAAAVWDRADLMSRLMDDSDLMQDIIREFQADTPRQIRLLHEFVAQGDLAGAERQAHSIKGASASVGGEALRRTASEIELAARAGNRDSVQSLLAELDTQFSRLQQAMLAASRP